ncbi:GntR family transcriptional regulator [Nocardia vinacea]|uniref:GntR family transcriptional regulator n=1 Tax=Nocardia vinacea TaxID=96468 RepID=UPI002E0F75C6|nr:GntR family transcriptional regulator [Nocardia vinacea]
MTVAPNRTQRASSAADDEVTFGKIEQRTTPGAVADVLRSAILAGKLAPGSQLREAHLAADLGVSRAPLREAFAILTDEGLVEKVAYRGAFVAQVSPREVEEMANIRRRLEPYAVELALPKLHGPGRSKALRALQEMARAADNGDLSESVRAHMRFHRVFYELSGNGLLLDLWRGWEAQLQMFLSVDHRSFADLHDVVAEHERLMSIIDTGDLAAITREIDRHVHGVISDADAGRTGTADA